MTPELEPRPRALRVGLSLVGLVLGVAGAVVWHYTHYRETGWTVYLPLNAARVPPAPHAFWWPTAVVFPLLGLALGWGVASVLGRYGWTLRRGSTAVAAEPAPGDAG
jgi:heme/copper-type cytochrome/quinol oxidase subunit 1